jgi:hypothetical protein
MFFAGVIVHCGAQKPHRSRNPLGPIAGRIHRSPSIKQDPQSLIQASDRGAFRIEVSQGVD